MVRRSVCIALLYENVVLGILFSSCWSMSGSHNPAVGFVELELMMDVVRKILDRMQLYFGIIPLSRQFFNSANTGLAKKCVPVAFSVFRRGQLVSASKFFFCIYAKREKMVDTREGTEGAETREDGGHGVIKAEFEMMQARS